jgi:serine/threonine-protein kinase RIO1
MELENLTLKQTLEGLVGENNALKETNAALEESSAKTQRAYAVYKTRWSDLEKSAREKRERAAAAKQKEKEKEAQPQ